MKQPRVIVKAGIAMAFLAAAGLGLASSSLAADPGLTKQQRAIEKQAQKLNEELSKIQSEQKNVPLTKFERDGDDLAVWVALDLEDEEGAPLAGLNMIACGRETGTSGQGHLSFRCRLGKDMKKPIETTLKVDCLGDYAELRKIYARGDEITMMSPVRVEIALNIRKGKIEWRRLDRDLIKPFIISMSRRTRDKLVEYEKKLSLPRAGDSGSKVTVKLAPARSARNAWITTRETFFTALGPGDAKGRAKAVDALLAKTEWRVSVAIDAVRDRNSGIARGGAEAAREMGSDAAKAVEALVILMHNDTMSIEARWAAMEALEAIKEPASLVQAKAYRAIAEFERNKAKVLADWGNLKKESRVESLGGENVGYIHATLKEKREMDAGNFWDAKEQEDEYQALNEFDKRRYRKERPKEIQVDFARIKKTVYALTIEREFKDKLYDFATRVFGFSGFDAVMLGPRTGSEYELALSRMIKIPRVTYTEKEAEKLAGESSVLEIEILLKRLSYRKAASASAGGGTPGVVRAKVMAALFKFPDRVPIMQTLE